MVTVLVVDDEPGFRHILAIILQRAGYEILQASDAFEARQIIEAHLPDLIILDDMMPGMSGSDLCIQLKRDVHYSHIPVVMHTANSKYNDPTFVESINADGVLLKPCTPRDILAGVGRFVQTQI
jgi:CheY-like chemotaxis protein